MSRAAEEMLKKGIDPNSPEAQLFGRKLLRGLTDVFGKCILETGFFHAGKQKHIILPTELKHIYIILNVLSCFLHRSTPWKYICTQ